MVALASFSTCLPWDSPDNPCTAWLSPNEVERLQSFKFPKRQREWLAGRMCAKAVLLKYYECYQSHLQPLAKTSLHITNLDSGRPDFIYDHPPGLADKPSISISHSSDYAVSFAAALECGIDIQEVTDGILRVKDRFCHQNEERLLCFDKVANNQKENLTLLWAAKEAAQKALSSPQMPGFLDLKLEDVQDMGKNQLLTLRHEKQGTFHHMIRVVAGFFKDYAIAISIRESNHA